MSRTLILIPTYNELENAPLLYGEIKKLKLSVDILFVDDNSPDGTGKKIKEIMKKDKSVKLLTRTKKEGIGSAHKAGISWAYQNGYKTLITMDSDFTHKPQDIKKLLSKQKTADIVLGSRYLKSGALSDWNFFRKTLTSAGHFLTKTLLGMHYDATGAFRLYRLDKIPKNIFSLVESKSYSFFFESMFVMHLNGAKIAQIAIDLPARTYGSSKMQISDMTGSLKLLLQTFFLSKVYPDSYIYSPAVIKPNKKRGGDEREWDEYWQMERKNRKIFYDTLAVFYRKYIIRRTLNHFINKTFKKGQVVLHAGCGGGQVDTDVVKRVKVTALDISSEALNRYKRLYGAQCRIMYGSIFKLPAKNGSFDGIYNLGVMEHLTKREIKITLDEFFRVLKPKGKIVLFWPPRFGLSVLFLNTVHFILNDILNKKIRLHPEEISKIESREQVEKILTTSGFKLTGFHFGPSDLFTYVVVVGEKTK